MKQRKCHGLPMAVVLQVGVLASSAQTYLFTGTETTVTLNPGIYNITSYGAQGGNNAFGGPSGGYSGGGGGGYGYAGGGGGSYIDLSALAVITQISGIASPDGSPNGEIIITEVPEPTTLALVGLGGLLLLLLRRNAP
jgi:hypothetical protein